MLERQPGVLTLANSQTSEYDGRKIWSTSPPHLRLRSTRVCPHIQSKPYLRPLIPLPPKPPLLPLNLARLCNKPGCFTNVHGHLVSCWDCHLFVPKVRSNWSLFPYNELRANEVISKSQERERGRHKKYSQTKKIVSSHSSFRRRHQASTWAASSSCWVTDSVAHTSAGSILDSDYRSYRGI
jgi:hypothetical protein